jgi:hypothetical protein
VVISFSFKEAKLSKSAPVFLLPVYEAGGGEDEEPPYQYVPESSLAGAASTHANAGALSQSMLLLADGLASGALVAQFERLYRKKPGLSMLHANKQENVIKNRYRDISPCK